jgi:hypothetical protein
MIEEAEISSACTGSAPVMMTTMTAHDRELLRSAASVSRGIDVSIPESSRLEGASNYGI